MASSSKQKQIAKGKKPVVSSSAGMDSEIGETGRDVSAQVDAALTLMDMADTRQSQYTRFCTNEEDLYVGRGKLGQKKRKACNDFSTVQSKKVYKVAKDGDWHETISKSEERKLIIKLPKKGKDSVESGFRKDDSDKIRGHGLKAEEKMVDVQNSSRLDISDQRRLKSRGNLKDPPISLKRKSGKGKDTDSDSDSSSSSYDEEPQARPSKKLRLTSGSSTSGSASENEEFSFSTIHFLSAIRKAFLSREETDPSKKMIFHVFTVDELKEIIKRNPLDPAILEAEEPLEDLIRGALSMFSSKVGPAGAKGWEPLASYKKSRKGWCWCHPTLSEATLDPISPKVWCLPNRIVAKMVTAFSDWLRRVQDALKQIANLPSPPLNLMQQNTLSLEERLKVVRNRKCVATITPCSEEIRVYFNREEAIRYAMPGQAFSYTTIDGRKSTVAPLKTSGKSSSRMHNHFLLNPNRPSNVNILCLVRDAAARLPARMGTRTDIAILLRDSQFVNTDAADKDVDTVVSRGLDRLHYELDPCVVYNGETKMWEYLHGERDKEELE